WASGGSAATRPRSSTGGSSAAEGTTMRDSRDRILTTHVGSLPRPDDLIEASRAREASASPDDAGHARGLRDAVVEVVRRQREVGLDVPGDGEFGKAMGHRVNYRAWWSYSFQR